MDDDWPQRSVLRVAPPIRPRKLAKVPFVELAEGRLQGVVSSGSDIERVYVSTVAHPTGADPSADPISSAAGLSLLAAHPTSVDAIAALLGLDPSWPEATPDVAGSAAAGFVARHPRTAQALAAL